MNTPVPARGAASAIARRFNGAEPAHIAHELTAEPRPQAVSEWLQVVELLKFARRRWLAISACLMAGLVAAVFVTRASVPVYRASSSVEVLGINEEFLNLRTMDPTGRLPAESYLQTQVEILQNEELVRQAAERFRLEKRPEFVPKPSATQRLGQWLGLTRQEAISDKERAIRIAQERLQVVPSRQSRIIRLNFDSRDPELAAGFVNALAEVYIQRDLASRASSATQVRQWLNPQLTDLKNKLDQSEARLNEFTRSTGVLYGSERESIAEDKLRQLQRDLAAAQADRISRQALHESIRKAEPDALPTAVDSAGLRDLRTRLTELKRQKAEVGALFTSDSQRVQRIQAQIDEIETAYRREFAGVSERTEREYQLALVREENLQRQYAAQADAVIEEGRRRVQYNHLKHDVDKNRLMYDSMALKVSEADIATAIKPSAARILNRASLPTRPHRPSVPLNLAIGLGSGLCFGLILAAFRELASKSIRSPEEASSWLHMPSLGAVPSAGGGLIPTRRIGNPMLRGSNRVELVAWNEKDSYMSESFREILASVLFSGEQHRVLLVASSNPGEGKTTITCNLAVSLAEIGKRVLIVDGDMRRPSVHKVFGQANTWGLSDLLSGGQSILDLPMEALVQATDIPGVSVLHSGALGVGIFRLLHSDRMAKLIGRFRDEFDFVLIDSPPAMQFADARLLAQVADAAVLVVESNKTQRTTAQEAARRLESTGVHLLGTIVNQWDTKGESAFRRYRYASSRN